MNSTTPNRAGRIGLRSSLIGSLLFAIILVIQALVKTDGFTLSAKFIDIILAIIVLFCIGSVLSAAPGYIGGKKIEKLYRTGKYNNLSLMAIGAGMGIIAVVLISLPDLCVVLAAHNYWSLNNNPLFPTYITWLIEAAIIAGLMGSWSGFQIAKS
jgi:hypothetical protein